MSGQMPETMRRRDAFSRHLTNLLAIAIAVAFVAVAVAYGIDALGRISRENAASDAAEALVPANVSGVTLSVPANWLRFPSQPNSAFSDRIDLALGLDLGGEMPLPITLSLVPKARARASSALLDSVYLQHFSKSERDTVPGLVGKPLSGGEGYGDETVWYDPIRANPFVAKCTAPLAEDDANACLRTLVLDSGLSAVIGFPEAALRDWRAFDKPLAAVFDRIGAGKIER